MGRGRKGAWAEAAVSVGSWAPPLCSVFVAFSDESGPSHDIGPHCRPLFSLVRNDPVTDHFETVTVQQLENFVEYVRFQMAFLDGLDNERFLSAAWEWPAPSTMMHLPSSP